jgi:hypothetical protein
MLGTGSLADRQASGDSSGGSGSGGSGGSSTGGSSGVSSGASSSGGSGSASSGTSGSSSGTGGSSSRGSSTSSGGSGSSSGSGGSSSRAGSSGSGASSGSSSGGCSSVSLLPTATGYVDVPSLNPAIAGSWYVYGDDTGPNGVGACETKGMFLPSQCSSITFPPWPTDGGSATFPQTTPGMMCLSGTAAQVIGTPPDYADIYGIAMGLDLNNPSGTGMPYNAKAAGITAFTFDVSGLPYPNVRVEFATPATDPTGDAWSYLLGADGPTTVNLSDLMPSFSMTTYPPFDPSQIESIVFHVVTDIGGPYPVDNFCISNLAVTVCH